MKLFSLPFVFSLLILSSQAQAEGGPIYDAIDQMIAQLTHDLPALTKTVKRIAVTGVKVSENLEQDVSDYLTTKIEGAHQEKMDFRFVQCKECMQLRAEANGSEVVVKKGITDQSELRKITSILGVPAYSEVNLTYTGTKVLLAINTYNAQDQALMWSKSYETRVLSLAKSGFKMGVTVEQLVGFDDNGYPMGLSLFAAERIHGFGEFGLSAFGAMKDGRYKNYVSVGPMLTFNINELSNSYSTWGATLITMRVNYGWFGKKRDINAGLGTRVDVGSYYHVALEAIQGFSMESKDEQDEEPKDGYTYEDDEEALKALPFTVMLGFGFAFG